jgi:membrane-bound serine protease (ClpP class)
VPLANLGIALGLSVVAAFFLAQFLPKIPMLRRLVLTTNEPGGGSLQTDVLGSPHSSIGAGDKGRAVSMLRPIGRAKFHGEIVDARAEGDFIPSGVPVRALRVEGSEVIVERERE